MTQYFLRLTRYGKVIWLTVDQQIDEASIPVLDFIEWPTKKKPWQTLLLKLQERPWIPSAAIYELVIEARNIFLYLVKNPICSLDKVQQLKEKFPRSEFRGYWVFTNENN